MRYWIKSLGSAEKQLPDAWQEHRNGVLTNAATFAKRPMVEKGDKVVYYAAGTKLIFAVGHVTSHPYESTIDAGGFNWRVDVVLDVKKAYVHDGASLDSLNIRPDNRVGNRIKRRSHVQLDEAEFAAAVAALDDVG